MAKKVMVVEDELEIRELLTLVLAQGGYEVATCDDGRQAWDAVANFKPDLIILDLMLPGVSGRSLQQLFSREPATRDIPIILASSHNRAKDIFADAPQVVDFMTKPFKTATILEKARSALESTVRLPQR